MHAVLYMGNNSTSGLWRAEKEPVVFYMDISLCRRLISIEFILIELIKLLILIILQICWSRIPHRPKPIWIGSNMEGPVVSGRNLKLNHSKPLQRKLSFCV